MRGGLGVYTGRIHTSVTSFELKVAGFHSERVDGHERATHSVSAHSLAARSHPRQSTRITEKKMLSWEKRATLAETALQPKGWSAISSARRAVQC